MIIEGESCVFGYVLIKSVSILLRMEGFDKG